MKIALLSAVAVLLLNGVAQAAIISETLTGIIASGTDTLDNFGGGDLAEDSFTLSFIYDTGLLTNDTLLGTDGSYYHISPGVDGYFDFVPDGALSEGLTINLRTFGMTSNFSNSEADVQGCGGLGCGPYNFLTYTVQDLTTGSRIQIVLVYGLTYSNGQVFSQAAVDAFDTGKGRFDSFVYLASDGGSDTFDLEFDLPSSVPEPTTWISLVVGMSGLAVLRRERRFIPKFPK